jgi:transcriptional regulator GlxA family with amidase domain
MDRVRTTRDAQPVSDVFPTAVSISVRRALLQMESNLQCPLEISRIAQSVGRSRRQLERLSGWNSIPAQKRFTLRLES